jgi:hypothetical protein
MIFTKESFLSQKKVIVQDQNKIKNVLLNI